MNSNHQNLFSQYKLTIGPQESHFSDQYTGFIDQTGNHLAICADHFLA